MLVCEPAGGHVGYNGITFCAVASTGIATSVVASNQWPTSTTTAGVAGKHCMDTNPVGAPMPSFPFGILSTTMAFYTPSTRPYAPRAAAVLLMLIAVTAAAPASVAALQASR